MNYMSKYDLYMWLRYEYDDKNKRHEVVERIYNQIRDKMDEIQLELKISEDDFYKELINFLVKNTKIEKNFR